MRLSVLLTTGAVERAPQPLDPLDIRHREFSTPERSFIAFVGWIIVKQPADSVPVSAPRGEVERIGGTFDESKIRIVGQRWESFLSL